MENKQANDALTDHTITDPMDHHTVAHDTYTDARATYHCLGYYHHGGDHHHHRWMETQTKVQREIKIKIAILANQAVQEHIGSVEEIVVWRFMEEIFEGYLV